MTQMWRCAERDRQADATDYTTEEAAVQAAEALARAGKLAVVWPVDIEEGL